MSGTLHPLAVGAARTSCCCCCHHHCFYFWRRIIISIIIIGLRRWLGRRTSVPRGPGAACSRRHALAVLTDFAAYDGRVAHEALKAHPLFH
jgi:hypothetical protein